MKIDKRPIDGYIIDYNAKKDRKEHHCDTCGGLTTNTKEEIATGYVEDDLCNRCLSEFYPGVNW